MRRTALIGVLGAFLLAGAGATAAHDGAHPSATPAPSVKRPGAGYFPNVELLTQDGRAVRFYDDLLKGKSVAIAFMFTSCQDVCPLETANMVQLRRQLGERAGKDIHLYSISIDPQTDTPAALKAYAEKFGADWTFLTGQPEDIKLIGKKLGMIRDRDKPTSRESHHGAILMIGDEPTGQWTRNSAVDNPRFLAARIGTFLGWRDNAPQRSYAEAKPLTLDNGQRLFQSKCSACHSIGRGDRLGPDLAGVTDRRERAWLASYIADSGKMREQGDAVAIALHNKYKKIGMPYLALGSSDIADLISYLQTRSTPQ